MSKVGRAEVLLSASSRARPGRGISPGTPSPGLGPLGDNFDSSPLGSRRASLALTDNFESTGGTPLGSRRASLALLSDNVDRTSPTSPSLHEDAHVTFESGRRNLQGSESSERHLMNLAVAAHEQQKGEKRLIQLQAAQKLKSNFLRVLLTNAVTGSMNKWSKAAKKAFFLSQVDSRLTRAHIERIQLNVMLALAIMNSACIGLQCASSRLLENSRDNEVARQQLSNLQACCQGFNLTLSNGACGEEGSEASTKCVPDSSLIVSADTDFAVAYGTNAFWMSFYLNAAVSALSILSVVAITYHAYLSKKLLAFSKRLETKRQSHQKNAEIQIDDTTWRSAFTPSHWFQIVLSLIHMPPLLFDIPTLQFEHPFYTKSKLLKFPWIALISAVVTLSNLPILPPHLIHQSRHVPL